MVFAEGFLHMSQNARFRFGTFHGPSKRAQSASREIPRKDVTLVRFRACLPAGAKAARTQSELYLTCGNGAKYLLLVMAASIRRADYLQATYNITSRQAGDPLYPATQIAWYHIVRGQFRGECPTTAT